MNRALKLFGAAFHRSLAKSRTFARIYFAILPLLSQWLPRKARQQLRNSIHTVRWPEIRLRPRTVILGNASRIRLRPHFDEFDFEALLARRLDYEREVFEFIEPRLADYDVIIEIGANVGVFTLFSAQATRTKSPFPAIYAFEPSRTAYARLLENLRLNGIDDVQTFNCAVGDKTGIADFFEPQGHIMNGSFSREFALQFSKDVRCTKTLVIDAELLDQFISGSVRVLIKMDAEGAEVMILRALAGIIDPVSPDLLLEVLPSTAMALNRIRFSHEHSYQLFHLTAEGPVERSEFKSDEYRDYFLTPSRSTRSSARQHAASIL